MNPFLNFVKDVKNAYISRYGSCSYEYEPVKNRTCLNKWVFELHDPYFNSILSGLSLHQYKSFIVAHYIDFYSAVDENGGTIQYKDFFYVHDSFYKECRGVVVDVVNEELVLCPFRKFFNLGEFPETSIDSIRELLKSASCVEFSNKLDGSMISARYYNNEIVVSGSSCNNPDLSVQLRNSISYIEGSVDYMQIMCDYPDDTFIFEHIFPSIDPHVVKYDVDGLYLVGLRNIKTGVEYSYHDVIARASKYNIPTTELYDLSLDEVVSSLDKKSASEAEGFVLNIDGFKVKIKYDDYVEIHKTLMGILSYNTAIKAVCDGTVDDVVIKIPETFRDDFLKKVKDVNDLVSEIDKIVETYISNVPDGDKKRVMQWINANVPKRYQAFVRNIYNGKEVGYLRNGSAGYKSYKELQELCNR